MSRIQVSGASRIWRRIASAAVLVPVSLGLLWSGGGAFTGFVALAAALMAVEWVAMLRTAAPTLKVRPMLTLYVVVLAAAAMLAGGALVKSALGLLVLGGFAAAALTKAHRPLFVWALIGPLYLGTACCAMLWLRSDPVYGLATVAFLLVTVWSYDTGAYVVGSAVGGPKLWPAVSPSKTWAGVAGGAAASALAGGILGPIIAPANTLAPGIAGAALAGAAFGLVGQGGDLFESFIKRRFGVKDSGTLIPGHGGVLDRLDALIAVFTLALILVIVAGGQGAFWGQLRE